VALVAPYGEQSRVTLRAEAEKASRPDVARAFAEANIVAWLLNKARFKPDFRESLQGADIYVDEASLLDNQTMLGLVSLARDSDARVIFQGDTRQLQAVGRGQPLAMLESDLGFGTRVGRIGVTRRQLKIEDKRLSRELSSGDGERFCAVVERIEEALMQATRFAKRFGNAARRRAERIREMRIKKRQEKVRSQWREQNRAARMAF
jgi:ATP-dependent exoDNAse (exonuclease V) alpha subunit